MNRLEKITAITFLAGISLMIGKFASKPNYSAVEEKTLDVYKMEKNHPNKI